MVQLLSNFTLALTGLWQQAGNWMVNSAQTRLDSIQQSFGTNPTTVAMAFSLPPLGYSYDALEPHFDKETMEIHHSKHHQTYVNNLNNLLKDHEFAALDVNDLVTKLDQVPAEKQTGVRNNAGGHSNHSFFWKNLKPGTTLDGELEQAIQTTFGSVDEFKAQFEKAATTVFGSGWAWLVHQNGTLKIVTTANQDSPLMGEGVAGTGGFPVIGLDVWEHAYYLKYQNRRPDYIKAFWSVVNWDFAKERFAERK
ncbi:Superoxide dismutase [Mn] [Lecanosticta acicola]|uniref:Superoxide dismutase n=1 Tax=Lecanosticta acicola TaxID=111012 RepID=A0AAI8YXG3_9PEZI|nr:Superoxide dismutase [Mn] [Lecanosticta acicola]